METNGWNSGGQKSRRGILSQRSQWSRHICVSTRGTDHSNNMPIWCMFPLLIAHPLVYSQLHHIARETVHEDWVRETVLWKIHVSLLVCRMETYTELCSRMLRQFQSLLRHDPCVFGKQQLVQMMAINMYQIEVAKQVNVSGKRENQWEMVAEQLDGLLSSRYCCSFTIRRIVVATRSGHVWPFDWTDIDRSRTTSSNSFGTKSFGWTSSDLHQLVTACLSLVEDLHWLDDMQRKGVHSLARSTTSGIRSTSRYS